MSLWCDLDAFARDLSRCWAMCVEKLRAMHWWAQLRGLMGVVVSAVGGGVYALVALGSSPVGKEGSWSYRAVMCGRLKVLLQLGGGGSGGLCGRVVDVPYRKRCAKYPMPPKGSTVNGMRAMLLSRNAWK